MALWQVLILAVVQGVTEFLPISSSGHLVIVAALTGVTDDVIELNIVLHVGTLLSIVCFYWQRIWRLLEQDRRVLGLLAVGTAPAIVIGLTLKTLIPEILESPLLAGCLLPVTGVLLLLAARGPHRDGKYVELSFGRAILIGISQAFAILPGISRSGATIAAGLRLGLSAESSATFSFLLAIPVIAGAGVLELKDLVSEANTEAGGADVVYLLIGAAVAFLVGLLSLWGLVRLLERGKIAWFAAWCIPVGIFVAVWRLF